MRWQNKWDFFLKQLNLETWEGGEIRGAIVVQVSPAI